MGQPQHRRAPTEAEGLECAANPGTELGEFAIYYGHLRDFGGGFVAPGQLADNVQASVVRTERIDVEDGANQYGLAAANDGVVADHGEEIESKCVVTAGHLGDLSFGAHAVE